MQQITERNIGQPVPARETEGASVHFWPLALRGVICEGVEPVGRRIVWEGRLKTGLPKPLQVPHLQPACLSVENLLPLQAQANREYPTLTSIDSWLGQPGGKGFSKRPQEPWRVWQGTGRNQSRERGVWDLGEMRFGEQ